MTTTVFLLLILFGIKHFIADFLLQFPYMLGQKGIYGAKGGIDHAALHAAFTLLVLIPFTQDATTIIGLSFVDFAIHYHIDFIKQQFSRGLTPEDKNFWLLLGADQALHYLTYIGIIYVVA